MLPHSPASEHCTKTLQNFLLCEHNGGEGRGRGKKENLWNSFGSPSNKPWEMEMSQVEKKRKKYGIHVC